MADVAASLSHYHLYYVTLTKLAINRLRGLSDYQMEIPSKSSISKEINNGLPIPLICYLLINISIRMYWQKILTNGVLRPVNVESLS